VPAKQLVLIAFGSLFTYRPKSKSDPKNEDYITKLQLAAFSSLYPLGTNAKSSLGQSHTLGYALGSPYDIPHGITGWITLTGVVRLKTDNPAEAAQIARALPFTGKGSAVKMTRRVRGESGDAIEEVVQGLGLGAQLQTISVWGVDQIPRIAKTAIKSEGGKLYDGRGAAWLKIEL